MNILLLGSGGREHALAWRLAQSPACVKLWAAPGNPGVAQHAECVPLNLSDHASVTAFCQSQAIDLVVVGPEAPLVDGIADSLRSAGIAVFGPNANAAVLEGSKGFVKDLCAAEGIPTASYVRHTDPAKALADLPRFGLPVVIKADGIAAGKGVIIAETAAEAEAAIADMFGGAFGSAGAEVVIEEFMTGEEASFFALTDGSNVVAFGAAQDHKRVGDGDTGPNTGGMGAYSPARVFTAALETETMTRIIRPTVTAMARAGRPYAGVLFAGLMLTEQGPKLIEYNCRFGDPECQVLMLRYQGDLAALLVACAQPDGLAGMAAPQFSDDVALTVVIAAAGYPADPRKGGAISGIAAAEAGGARVFHAGTAEVGGTLVASGGRVLNVTASSSTVGEAQANAYTAVALVNYADGFCRRDIGQREVAREQA